MNKKVIAAIAIYVALVAVCVIAVYAVPSLRGMLEKTYIAEYGSIDVKDEVSAFIVRDETVYVAAEDSSVNRLADPDKLVKANTHIVELTPVESAAAEETAEETEKAEKDAEKSDKDAEKADKDDKKSDKDADAKDSEAVTGNTGGKYSEILEELGGDVVSTEGGYNIDPGYVSYYVDGAESMLSTDSLASLSYNDFKALTGKKAIATPKKSVSAGEPIFKVVKNAKWYLVFYMKNKAAEKYEPGETVTIEAGGNPVEVTVSQVLTGRKYSKVTLSCKAFFDGFFEVRNLDTTVTVQHAEGLVLEDASIVEDADGQKGVFVKNKLGEHVFTPIAVKADNGTNCVVYSDLYVDEEGNYVETIDTYDEIMSEPGEEDLASLKKKADKAEEQGAAEDTNKDSADAADKKETKENKDTEESKEKE